MGDSMVQLVAIWRGSRSPRVAELIEVLSDPEAGEDLPQGRSRAAQAAWLELAAADDPGDLPRLLRSLTGGTSTQAVARLEALEDDPRLVTHLLGLLERPPFTAGSTTTKLLSSIAPPSSSGCA